MLFESMSPSIRLGVLPTTESVALRSLAALTEPSASPFGSASFRFMYFGALLPTPNFLTPASDTPKPQALDHLKNLVGMDPLPRPGDGASGLRPSQGPGPRSRTPVRPAPASRPCCRTPARLLRVSRARRPVPASAFPLRALVPGPRKLPLQVHFAGPSPSSRAKQCPCLPRRRAGAALRPRPPLGLCIASCVTVRNDLTGLSGAPAPCCEALPCLSCSPLTTRHPGHGAQKKPDKSWSPSLPL